MSRGALSLGLEVFPLYVVPEVIVREFEVKDGGKLKLNTNMLVANGKAGTDLFPAVHGLLVLLAAFEEENVDYLEVLDMSMLLELVTDGRAHLRRRNRQRIERTDFWCLEEAVDEPREPSVGLVDRSLRDTSLGRAGERGGASAWDPTRTLQRVRVWMGALSSLSPSSVPIWNDAGAVVEVSLWFGFTYIVSTNLSPFWPGACPLSDLDRIYDGCYLGHQRG